MVSVLRTLLLCVLASGCSMLQGASQPTPDASTESEDVTESVDVRAPGDEVSEGPAPTDVLDADDVATDLGPSCEVASDLAACVAATSLRDGAALRGLDAGQVDAGVCGASTRWYQVDVPAGYRVRVRVTSVQVGLPQISLRGSCDDDLALDPDDRGDHPHERYLRWDNPGAATRSVRVALAGGSARFDLHVEVSEVPPTARCASAPRVDPVMTPLVVPLQDSGEATTGCGVTRPSRLYRVQVPAGNRITATLGPGAPTASLRLLETCPVSACLGSVEGALSHDARVDWTNRADRAVDVFLALSASSVAASTQARLTVVVNPPAANARCTDAVTLLPSTPARGDTGAAERAAPGCVGADAPALYYRVEVPVSHRVVITTQGGRVRLLDGCASSRCVGDTARGEWWWTNDTASTRHVVVAVSSEDASEAQPFVITANINPTPTNGRCATPLLLPMFMSWMSHFAEDAREPVRACGASASPALFYRVTVPSRHTIEAGAGDDAGRSLSMALLDRCDGSCLIQSSEARRRVTWTNAGREPRDVILAAQPDSSGESRRVNVFPRVFPAERYSLCATAVDISAGYNWEVFPAVYEGQAVDRCVGDGSVEPAVFHRVLVAPRSTVLITQQVVEESERATLRAFTDCADLSACAARGVVMDPTRVTLTWTNNSETPQPLIVASNYVPLRAPRRYRLWLSQRP